MQRISECQLDRMARYSLDKAAVLGSLPRAGTKICPCDSCKLAQLLVLETRFFPVRVRAGVPNIMITRINSTMKDEANALFMYESYHNSLEWLSFIGEPILYDGELYVLRRTLKPGTNTYKYYIKIHCV